MEWLGPVASLLGFFGGQGQARAQERGSEAQSRIIDYILNRRRDIYDPIEEQEFLPRVRQRASSTPFYANTWLRQARQLRNPSPWTLNY